MLRRYGILVFFFLFVSIRLWAAQHLISVVATTPFPSSVAASLVTTAVYTVTNITSIPLTIQDQTKAHSGLPASVAMSNNTCGSLLSPNGTCTITLTLTAPDQATSISGTLYEHAFPSLEGVTASFGPITVTSVQLYTVTPSAGSNGSISPSTPQTLNSGESMTFTATPSSSYNVNQWKLDGVVVQTGGGTYTLSNVTANHTVNVSFSLSYYWTWMSGSSALNQAGVYGTQGTPASGNVPGARYGSMSWIDSSNNLWLLGGYGYDRSGSFSYLNDLWKFDGSQWTWVSGASSVNQSGTYGTQGTPASGNVPGARYASISWIDSSNNLWLFGGSGYNGSGSTGYLNDLWKFDGSQWTCVSGTSSLNQYGTYGTQGTPASGNVPGARGGSISWIDSSNNLWLLGGYGYDGSGGLGYLNDLWKFNGSQWTWVSGASSINQLGTS